jgi:YfiH family protein
VRLPEPFQPLGDHISIGLPGARVAFTTRRGGFSRGPYRSLNLGRRTDDDPRLVSRNRASLEAEIGVELRYTRQVHGPEVARIAKPGRTRELLEADGQATAIRGVAPAALVADCLPVAIAARGAIAMLHAGWRGLAAGIIQEGVAAVRELGGSGRLEAAIGPGAGGCCYEVGEEVKGAFDERFPHARKGRNLDLKVIARSLLEQAGVSAVHDLGICTICADRDLFYSHRRDNGVTGRQAGVVWLN